MGLIRNMAQVLPGLQGTGPGMQPQSSSMHMPMTPQGGMANAFAGNPQFQQQLMALLQGQGPGMQPPQFTPPQMPMSTGPTGGANMWHDGIPGNAQAAGIPRPSGMAFGGMRGGGMQGGLGGVGNTDFDRLRLRLNGGI